MVRDKQQFLDDLSQAISDGQPVDWGHVTGAADAQTRSLLDQLRIVADIAKLHRETLPDPADEYLPTPGELVDMVDGRWGHLTLRRIIGRGARGLVYRAWDPQLDREVALKLIAQGPESADEVLDEARQLARVHHPNVAIIHGAERSDGMAGLWMELIEGRTLENILRDDGIFSAREAALIGVDVCAALAAVHKAGVLHRDVKAQNVMRDRGGRIVLMDFGTSRMLDTTSDAFTHDEVGTPLYMAPELLLGGKASVRSDIYSVGVLLYRLVTGSVPVEASSVETLRAAHAEGSVKRLSDERSDLPLAFIHIVERALSIDPAARYGSAGALEMALSGFLAPSAPHETAPARGRVWPLVAAGLAGLIAGGVLMALGRPDVAVPTQELRFPLYPPATHEIESMALAPDGTRIAFTSAGQLWLRRLDHMEPWSFANTQGAHDPFWSPDGETIAFFKGVSVWKVAAEGGEPQVVAPARRPSTGSWGADGSLLYSVDLGRALVVVPAGGGEPRTIREQVPGGRVSLWWPSYLQSGKAFVYSALDPSSRKRALYLARVDRPASDDTLLIEAEGNVQVAGDALLFARLGQLMRQRFDEASATLVGTPEVVADHIRTNPYNYGEADVTASAAGPVAFVAGVQEARQLQLVDAQGRVLRDLGEPGEYRDIALSHDGTRLAFEEVDPETGTRDVWIHDLDRGTRVRLSQHPADETSPMWAPDDDAVYFMSNRDQQTVLLRKPVNSSGQEERVLTFDVPVRPTAITADGLGLFYEQLDQVNGSDLWWRPLDGGDPQPYLQSSFHDHEPVPSPDGRFVAYASPDSGGRQVYLGTRQSSERRWRVSTDYGREPLWRADGRELFFHGKDRMLMVVSIDVVNGEPVVGTPRPLFELRFRGYDLRYHYAVLPDGRRFVLNAPVSGSTALPATIVVRR